MTLIVGARGSMGLRYQSILNFLGEQFEGYDPKDGEYAPYPLEKYDRFIIASPTSTHLTWIRLFDRCEKPILCEKPLSTDLREVEEILKCKSPLTMQMQYAMLVNPRSQGRSHYDYYNAGPDGLAWSCFQIIALASAKVELHNESPVWRCTINGTKLKRDHMDQAYVDYVRAWLGDHIHTTRETLLEWHLKVERFAKGQQ